MADNQDDVEELRQTPSEELDPDTEKASEDDSEEAASPDPPIIRSKFAFAALILIVVMVPILGFLGIGIPADTDSLFVGSIVAQEDGTLKIPIHTTSSSLAFCMTTQKFEEGALYLKPRLSFSSFLHQSGSTHVVTKHPADRLTAIYLQGSSNEDLLQIWP